MSSYLFVPLLGRSPFLIADTIQNGVFPEFTLDVQQCFLYAPLFGKSGFFRGNPADATGDFWGAYDNGLSNAYLILKARAMGFDTLIMGMRNADALRALFDIPEDEMILPVIALGYRAQDPNTPTHRPLDEIAKFY